MGQLRIYMHASGEGAMHRSGFSWGAAIAFPVWALTKRLYKTAAVWSGCFVALSLLIPRLLSGIQDEAHRVLAVLSCLMSYWLAGGLIAGRWHRHVLERRRFFVCGDETPLSRDRTP
jgi:Protein of unknown function (DUF2628)